MSALDLTRPEHIGRRVPLLAKWWECDACGDYAHLWPDEEAPECSCSGDEDSVPSASTVERVRITYGGDTVTMSWDGAQASAPILVDGSPTGYQTADARHRTSAAVRLVASRVWSDVGHRPSDWAEGAELWSELAYETLEAE